MRPVIIKPLQPSIPCDVCGLPIGPDDRTMFCFPEESGGRAGAVTMAHGPCSTGFVPADPIPD
jgi:hypothetical protein